MHSTKLIFFDLDGTLIDSLPDLAWAVDRMMLSMNKTPPGILNTKSWVGNGAAKLIKRALTHSMDAEPEAKEFHHAQQLFNRFYSETLSVRSRLYEGVMVTLEQLKRHAIGFVCITNKPSEFTLPLLQQLCLTPSLIWSFVATVLTIKNRIQNHCFMPQSRVKSPSATV